MKAIEKLGALITIAQKAKETNQDAPLDSVELIHQFGEFVDIDFDDAEEDVDDVGEEISEDAHEVEDEENENTENEVMADSEVSIDIPSSLDVDVKAKIQSHFAIIQQAKLDLLPLASERKEIADCLKRTRAYLALLKKSKRAFRSDRKKQSESLESQMFKVLKSIGVELTRYHGGSLNGKDIKTVTNNASYVFDEWSKILKKGKRKDCTEDIDALCVKYKSVFLLWDGAFSIARKVNPSVEDRALYRRFANAAVDGHCELGCSITHKVHLMWKHVEWQMKAVEGGLGDKMEDWVELQHQWGMRLRRRFRTVVDPLIRARARAKVLHRDTNPHVVAYSELVSDHYRRDLKEEKILKEAIRKEQREKRRMDALEAYEAAKVMASLMEPMDGAETEACI